MKEKVFRSIWTSDKLKHINNKVKVFASTLKVHTFVSMAKSAKDGV
jgi:hypothetical protein